MIPVSPAILASRKYVYIYIYTFIYTVYIVTGVIFCLTGIGDLLAPLLGNIYFTSK